METKREVVPAVEEILGLYFRVLDHGFVCLKDYMGSDIAIAQAARVSYGAGTKGISDDRSLLRYMLSHNHTSPYEQVELKFHVKLPIFVARQLIRHRTANINEYSMRYSFPVMQFYMPNSEVMGTQSIKNKQGRSEAVSAANAELIKDKWKQDQLSAVEFYEYLTSKEIDLAREIARIGLPLSIYTEWFWKIDLHNLLHFLTLRSDSHAQWEIQQYSNVKAAMIKRIAPIAYEAWIDYQFQSHKFSRLEMIVLIEIVSNITTANNINERCINLGMSKREISEFTDVLSQNSLVKFDKPIEFELNPADGLSGDILFAEAQQYIPKSL